MLSTLPAALPPLRNLIAFEVFHLWIARSDSKHGKHTFVFLSVWEGGREELTPLRMLEGALQTRETKFADTFWTISRLGSPAKSDTLAGWMDTPTEPEKLTPTEPEKLTPTEPDIWGGFCWISIGSSQKLF